MRETVTLCDIDGSGMITHICRLNKLMSDKTTRLFDEYGFNVLVGYDGMEVL
jgi:hypothetical protein